MGIFSFLFGGGKYPTTSKYEAKLEQAKADFARFKNIASSTELKRLEELKKLTASADFKSRVEHLKNDRFNQTEEYRKEQELKALAKSSDIKGYLKFVAAGNDKKATAAIDSAAYKEYATIQASTDPKAAARIKELKRDANVKMAIKMLASSAYANFKKTANSDRLKKYEALKEYVKTDAFLAKKKDLENKNRFKESGEHKQLQELEQLSKNKDLKWYASNLAAKTFANADKWQLTFADDFKGNHLDAQKWLTGYYWGKKTAGITYSLADERQAFNDKNAVVNNGLDIQTRAGKAQGNVWDPLASGFVKKDLEATAAIITTGDSFRQKFGKFDFKVKVSGVKAPVTNNVWLSSDRNAEVNVATFGKCKTAICMGITANGQTKLGQVNDVKYASDHFIYSLEWTANKLTWSINGVEVYSTTANVPQEPMYIGLSSNIVGEGDIANADMDVEWVRAYAQKQQ